MAFLPADFEVPTLLETDRLWVRTSEAGTGLEDQLYQTVRRWVADRWPFRRVAFPGRDGGRSGGPARASTTRSTTW